MLPLHQYFTSTQNLLTDFVVSENRIKVLTIHISNSSLTQLFTVCVQDKDGNTLMDIACPPKDSTSVTFAQPVDFSNGLVFDAAPSNGDSVRVAVAHTREI